MSSIATKRLLLRRARPDDIDAMHLVLSDPKAMRYWSTLPHETLDQTRAWLASMIESDPLERDDYLVERDGQVIGKAGCWRLPQIGFILRSDQWGQGLGREALEAAVGAMFRRHAFDRLTADVDPRNQASLALLRRLGFEETGRAARTWRLGEEWCDSIYLALPRSAAAHLLRSPPRS